MQRGGKDLGGIIGWGIHAKIRCLKISIKNKRTMEARKRIKQKKKTLYLTLTSLNNTIIFKVKWSVKTWNQGLCDTSGEPWSSKKKSEGRSTNGAAVYDSAYSMTYFG